GAVRGAGTAPASERAVGGSLAEDGSVATGEAYAAKSRAGSGRIAGASVQRLDAGGAAGGCAKRLSISRLWSQRRRWDPAGILGVHQPCLGRQSMSVARVTEIISASDQSFEHAVQEGVQRANQTLENIKEAWVASQKVVVENGNIVEYRVTLKVTFVLR